MKSKWSIIALAGVCLAKASAAAAAPQSGFAPFVWKSEPPADCPFPPSREITGVEFPGVHSDYRFADT